MSSMYVLVYFYTDWAGTHWLMKTQLDLAKKKITNIPIVEYNMDNMLNVFELGIVIRSIPTLALFKNGKLIASHVGVLGEKDIIKFVQENMNKV